MTRVPSPQEAEQMLSWAEQQNPGPWVAHCRTAARAARTIARTCGMDEARCYALGLLHDIGRYEGVRHLHHVIAGYDLMMARGYDGAAMVCLTHSFPVQDIAAYNGNNDCTQAEAMRIARLLEEARYTDELRLIQLCDALSLPAGVTVMDCRLMHVALRHGITERSVQKWRAFFALKEHFNALCGQNIYALFADDIKASLGIG